jgi:trk system potassium uptake protein TrkH
MGVLVFIMAFLPLSGGRNMHMMKVESPGPTVGKLVPKVRTTAKILYTIYFGLTVIQFVLLLCGGMSIFDSLNTAFATAGTGGFAIKADGFAGYSSYLQIVVAVFMLIFSINFNSYYFLLKRKWKEILTAEVKVFLIIVGVAVTAITLNVYFTDTLTNFWEAWKHSLFSVATVISTTGFATKDFNLWPSLSKTILVILMFIGACAGSTGGGVKVSRFIILGKNSANEMRKTLHPKQVKRLTIDGRVVEHEVVQSVYSYLVAYIFLFVASLLVISLEGESLVTTFTSVAATINNIGPGLDAVGPMGTFAHFSWWSKLVFIFDMLVGRLEIFPMLLLFAPSTWRK